MFEEYLNDSHGFYLIASEAQINGDINKARRYYRVSTMCALSALESFVNYTATSFDEANNLGKLEICFLTDKEQYFSPTQGVKIRVKFNPLDEKLKVLIRRFNPKYDFGKSFAWSNFIHFKDFRDSLVHSRKSEDETPLGEYESQVKSGLKSVIELMDLMSLGIYKKPLRKTLLDLIPE